MIYFVIASLAFAAANTIMSLICLKRLRVLMNTAKDVQQSEHHEHDIHNILNDRLLDLQHRRYAVQRHRRNYE